MKNEAFVLVFFLAGCFSDNVPSYDEPVEPDVEEQELIQDPIVPWSTPFGTFTTEPGGWVNTQSALFRGNWFNTPSNSTHYYLEFQNQGAVPHSPLVPEHVCSHVRRVNECNYVEVCWYTQQGRVTYRRKYNAGQTNYSQCGQNGFADLAPQRTGLPPLMYSNQWSNYLRVDWNQPMVVTPSGHSPQSVTLPVGILSFSGSSGLQTQNVVFRGKMDAF